MEVEEIIIIEEEDEELIDLIEEDEEEELTTINEDLDYVFPKLKDLEVTPSLEEQTFNHPDSYGYDEVKVKPYQLDNENLEINPTLSEQSFTSKKDGYRTVKVNALETEDLIIVPEEKQQKFIGIYREVNVEPIPSEYIIPKGELQITKNGVHSVREYKDVNVEVIPKLQYKVVTPTKDFQYIGADKGYDGLSFVDVGPIPEEYSIPTGELMITNNGVHNVKDYASVKVDFKINLQTKFATPNKEYQIIEADEGYDGLEFVDILPISDEYVMPTGELIIFENDKYDVREYEEVSVEVAPKLQFKSTIPTKEYQVIEADKGYDGLGCVDVSPIPDEYIIPNFQLIKSVSPSIEFQTIEPDKGYDAICAVDVFPVTSDIDKDIIPENIRDGVEILGVRGTLKSEGAKYAPQYISWRQQDATDLTYEVTNIDSSRIISCMRMFDTCSNLTELDLSSWTLESCNRLGYMFYNSTKLKNINMSNFDTRNVIYMNSMFYQCKALPSVDISHFNPKSLTNVNAMFQNCIALTEVDISSICTTKISNSALMFSGCTNLTKVIINSPSVFPMTNKNFFASTPIEDGTGYVYVPDNLVATYKARTNWTTYADQIKPISELEVA